VHIKVDLSQADVYDDLFPPSMFTEPPSVFTEPASDLPDVSLSHEDTQNAARTAETVHVVDDAFEDVDDVNPFVGKTAVSNVKHCCVS